MGLLNDLLTTYESVIGHEPNDMERIAPIAHRYIRPPKVLDITVNREGSFCRMELNEKNSDNTLVAMTEKSETRTGNAISCPHALNDKLVYMIGVGSGYQAYMAQLSDWCESDESCKQIKAVRTFLSKCSILNILKENDLLKKIPKGKDGVYDYTTFFVRWRVVDETSLPFETWRNPDTIASWTNYYTRKHAEESEKITDCITGLTCDKAYSHPKAIPNYPNAKLISTATGENTVCHFKGNRFTDKEQVPQIGYVTSQKIHNALSWLISTQAITISKNALPYCKSSSKPKLIVGWVPDNTLDRDADIQLQELLGIPGLKQNSQYQSHRSKMKNLIYGTGYAEGMQNISIFMMDISTPGRFSPVLYKSFSAAQFMERIKEWHTNCAWYSYSQSQEKYVVKPVSLFEIAKCAYGVQREKNGKPYLDVTDASFFEAVNTLLTSVLDGSGIPIRLMNALTSQVAPERFSGTKGYEYMPFNEILKVSCAVLHWIHVRKNGGEKDMELDKRNMDRSYLYGRLLAVFDRIENAALNMNAEKDEKGRIIHRDTNAMRLWSAYVVRPKKYKAILQEKVNPYLSGLPYSIRKFYMDRLTEIGAKIAEVDDSNRGLSPEYLSGFYVERAALSKRKDSTDSKETMKEDVQEEN